MTHAAKAFVSIFACALAAQVLADHTNSAEVNISPIAGSGAYHQLISQMGPVNASGSASAANPASSGSAAASTNYGLITGAATAFGNTASTTHSVIHDTISITAPGVATGTAGTLTYAFSLSGAMSATTGQSVSSWQASCTVGTHALTLAGGTRSPELIPQGPYGDFFGTYQATIAFQFGVAIPVAIEVSGSANSAYSVSGPGNASLSNLHLAWNGLVVARANGVSVPTFALVSESGAHWEHVSPLSCGSADFNKDGDTATDADIEDFFACLAGNCCPTCDSADFNGDGDTATDTDIEAFFRVLAGGSC